MSKKSIFATLLLGMSFAANAKVSKSLKKINEGGSVSDEVLAAEAKTTKAYKEDKDFAKKVDEIIAGKVEASQPKPEPAKTTTSRPGERR